MIFTIIFNTLELYNGNLSKNVENCRKSVENYCFRHFFRGVTSTLDDHLKDTGSNYALDEPNFYVKVIVILLKLFLFEQQLSLKN